MWMLYIIAEAHRAVSLNRLNNRRTVLWERYPQQLKLVWENNHASRQKTGIYLVIYKTNPHQFDNIQQYEIYQCKQCQIGLVWPIHYLSQSFCSTVQSRLESFSGAYLLVVFFEPYTCGNPANKVVWQLIVFGVTE